MQQRFLRGKGRSASEPSPPTSHYPQQSQADTDTIQHWTQTISNRPSITEEGLIDELMSIIQSFFEQIETAAVGHHENASVCEEYKMKFRLLKNDNLHLDRTLVEAPEVQAKFVSNLVALLLVLGTGSNLLPIVVQEKFETDTPRVVEQASQLAFVNPARPEQYPTNNLSEFLHAKKAEIKSIIDNLHDLLPIIHNLFENLAETELRQADEIGPGQTQSPDVYQSSTKTRPGQITSRSTRTPPSGSSSTSHGAEVPNRLDSTLSMSSTKQSSWRTSISSTISLILAKKPMSSTPPSEAKQSQGELKDSDSAHTSTSYEKANALDGPAEVDQLLIRKLGDGQPCHKLEETMEVKIYDQNHKGFLRIFMLIDTGSGYNFISRSVVKDLGLDTINVPPRKIQGFAGLQFDVDQKVLPKWQFSRGENAYEDFVFHVVSEIPGGSIVLGKIDIQRLDIYLFKLGALGALVAAEDPEGVYAKEQRKSQQRRQERDLNESQMRKQQTLKAKYAESIEQKAAAKASDYTNAGSSISQRGSYYVRDVQRKL